MCKIQFERENVNTINIHPSTIQPKYGSEKILKLSYETSLYISEQTMIVIYNWKKTKNVEIVYIYVMYDN
jgi:hypothetical protein